MEVILLLEKIKKRSIIIHKRLFEYNNELTKMSPELIRLILIPTFVKELDIGLGFLNKCFWNDKFRIRIIIHKKPGDFINNYDTYFRGKHIKKNQKISKPKISFLVDKIINDFENLR